MSSRKRSLRPSRLPLKRSIRPLLEDLEPRLVLSQLPIMVGPPLPTSSDAAGTAGHIPDPTSSGPITLNPDSGYKAYPDAIDGFVPQVQVYHAPGSYPAGDAPNAYGILPYDNGAATPAVAGYGPATIRAAYGVNDINFDGIVGDGAGQTIAVVDFYDNPNLVDSTSPNFSTSDLGVYDSEFNIPNLPTFSFTKVGETGGAPPTATDPTGGWEVEEALDVEMIHLIAPAAAIVLVEASTSLFTADQYAATIAPVVSNSWGSFGEYSSETSYDPIYTVPNVTFLYATGDSGSPGGYPAYSPDVVAVGGTSLYTNSSDNVSYETGWNSASTLGGYISGAGGGGTSQIEPEPSYQQGVQSTGQRTIPDVSSNASPQTGVAVYDGFNGGWLQVGGTSEACPTWAAYIAIANQGRALVGAAPLTGYDQTLPALYSLPYSDFNDITSGQNSNDNPIFDTYLLGLNDPGYQAKPGYDEITGLGSPRANLLVPDLAAYGIADKLVVTTDPPANVASGDAFGLTVSVEDQFGNVDTSYNGTGTLSLTSNPGGASFNPITATFVNGQAVFDGLSLSPVSQGYQFQATAGTFTANSSTFNVVSPTAQTGSFYPATDDASLRAAITAADSSNFSNNIIYLEAGTYTLTDTSLGQLVLADTASGVPNKSFTIIGQGPGSTIIKPNQNAGFASRIFQIVSQSGASVTVNFENLTISGGYAVDGGILGGTAALGGGLLIDGGTVSLTNVDLTENVAAGAAGANGGPGKAGGGAGGTGGSGAPGQGGAFYLAGGSLSLNNTKISQNLAFGGHGGSGGRGGAGFGAGGAGGSGGRASGGAGYVASGTLAGGSNSFESNAAVGGTGGSGATGGTGAKDRMGGAGGAGGPGGYGLGAGIFVSNGSINLVKTAFDNGWAQGGLGGFGAISGLTKNPATAHGETIWISQLTKAGAGGSGGIAAGGGIFVLGGNVSVSGGFAASNLARGGSGAPSGLLNWYIFGFASGYALGTPGFSDGGGIFVGSGSLSLFDFTVSRNISNYGGGLEIQSGSIQGSSVEFSGNQAYYGGGILNYANVRLNGGVVADNSGIYGGGGIYNVGNLYLTNVSVINNSASSGVGGGIDNTSIALGTGTSSALVGNVYANNINISSNIAGTRGGGIYSAQGSLTITGVNTIDDNKVVQSQAGSSVTIGFGGGIDVQKGSAQITGATISGNSSEFGGGIFVYNGNVSITNDTISDNSAVFGGGIHNGLHNQGTLTISDATITGNTASKIGGGINNRGPLTITNSTISDNTAGTGGGGIQNVGTVTVNTIAFTDNTAGTNGGGIDNLGTASVTNSTFTGNQATGLKNGNAINGGLGGAIYNAASLTLVTTSTLDTTTLSQNTAIYGGGLYNNVGSKASADDVAITSNVAAAGDGGGIFSRGALSITGGSLTDNQAHGDSAQGSGLGGALYLSGGKLTIAGSANALYDITGNSAVIGGGIYLTSGTLTLSLTQLSQDTAAVTGGAVLNQGTLVISNSTVSYDTAISANGGAIENSGKLTVTSSTFSNNSAGIAGGSIGNLSTGVVTVSSSTIGLSSAASGGDLWSSGTLNITSSTVSFGTASVSGGGIYDGGKGLVNLSNSTIAENTGVSGGGIYMTGSLTTVNATIAENQGGTGSGLDIAAGTALLYNTIVDGNLGGTDVAGSLATASSNNLFGSGASSLSGANGNLVGITSPDLGTLANNGGPTETIALLSNSPAIDEGANTIPGQTVPTTDQRGALRGSLGINAGTTVDIGAYEASSSYLISSAADSTAAEGTLRSGLNWAAFSSNDNPANLAHPAPNTLIFDTKGAFATPKTITLTLGTLVMPTTEPVAIDGPGVGVVTISGGGVFQVINVPHGATVTLEGITIEDGTASSGGGVESNGTLTLINTNLQSNTALNGGGLSSTGQLKISGGVIENNQASNGAGLDISGSLYLSDATIKANTASTNGGGVEYSGGTGGKLTITGSTLSANKGAESGGGIYIGSGAVSITGGSVTNNTANQGGGLFDNGATVTVTSTALTDNSALNASGGAIDIAAGTLNALELTIENNSATTGGAIANAGQATINASNLTSNSATTSGGGIINSSAGHLTLSSSTISDNLASGVGGMGGGLANNGTLTVNNSTLSGNSSSLGGGIFNSIGSASLTNATIAENSASTGGGIDNDFGTLVTMNSTIADNSVGTTGSGGGLYTSNNEATLYNTIVDSNTAPGGINVVGTLSVNASHNLINTPNAELGPLANNGGPTETIALLAGSPAIDAGANHISGQTVPTTDQRGALRGTLGLNAGQNVDIGAYEASSSYAVTGASSVDTTLTGTLRSAVGWANVNTNDNPINLVDPAPNTVQINSTQPFVTTLSPTLGTLVLSNTTSGEAIENIGSTSVTIRGGNAIGVLQVQKGVTASLSNLTISGGSATTGGGINNAGSLTLYGITITGNSATTGGGINNTGTLSLESSTFNSSNVATTIFGNQASGLGGGVYDSGTLTLAGSTISGNSAASGGGVAVGGSLTLSDASEITGNTASANGGGIEVLDNGILTVSESSVAGNTAASGGGIDNTGTLTLTNAQVTANIANTGVGGGIDNESFASTTVSYSTVQGNSAAVSGGGIDNNGTLSLLISTVSSNTAGTTGGGISDEAGASLTLANSTLSGNSATGLGGGLDVTGAASLSNATIAANKSGSGGGVYTMGNLTLVNTTIAENSISATGSGGGIFAPLGTATLINTIVASNTAGASAHNNAAGSLAPTSANNLFGTGGSGGLAALEGNLVNVANPKLGPLANNGGPTETVALLAGSPAIDAGANSIIGQTIPTTDQRGALRGSAGLDAGANVDIGAYEASSSYLVSTTTDSSLVGTLRSGVEWANLSTNANPEALAATTSNGGIAPPNTLVFPTTGAFSSPQTITLASDLGPIALANSITPVSIDGTSSNGLTISGGGSIGVITVAAGTSASLDDLTISGGHASSGGAIDNAGTLLVSNSTLSGNTANIGGAIANSGTLTLDSSTLSDNSAVTDGGGINNVAAGVVNATNDTIAGNQAAAGGGIFDAGTLTTVNTTIVYNTSAGAQSGGGLNASAGASLLYNSIVAQNTDGSGADDVAGNLSTLSENNLFGVGGSGGLGTTGNNQINVSSPGLGTLSNNGGPTQTIPLATYSPAVNAGSSSLPGAPQVDQRGAIRGVGDIPPSTAIDIGAYEISSSYLVTTPTDSTSPGTLRTAINWANVDPGSSPIDILFDTKGAFKSPQTITLALGTLNLTETSEPININGPGANILTVSGNGAVGVFSMASNVTADLNGLTIADGSAPGSGGAINNAGDLTVANALLTDGSTTAGSGAGIANTGTLTVSNSEFSNDVAAYYGGAIYNDGGTATVTNSNFLNNTAVYGLGGAIDNQGGVLSVTGSTFESNTSFQGAAIFNRSGTTTITDSTLSDNSAYQGGGIFNDGTTATPGNVTVSDSTIAENTAFQGGGVSNNFGGTMTIVDSTLANNSANQYGGAIDNVSTLTLISSTVAYNSVPAGAAGAGIDAYGGTTALYDTIVDLNNIGSGTSAVSDDISGSVSPSSAYNMIDTGDLTNGVNNNLVGVTKPGLASGLANNGGPTQTIALLAGSPAIGAGSATISGVTIPTTDQTGSSRPLDSFDIGAYQYSFTPIVVTPIVAAVTPQTPTSTVATVTPSVASTNTNAVAPAPAPTIVTTQSPFSGRRIGSKSSHKPNRGLVHPSAHHPVRTVSVKTKTPSVRIVKPH